MSETRTPDETIGCGQCGAEAGEECRPGCTGAAAETDRQAGESGRQIHAGSVARWPHLYEQPCRIVRSEWPYDCGARDAHPDHAVFRCEPHGVWWHEADAELEP